MSYINEINIYIFGLGSVLVTAGVLELILPGRVYTIWKKWIDNRFFFLHGILLITAGFPLIMYDGYQSTFVFILGCTALFTGPFILIYPEKIRHMYSSLVQEMDLKQVEKFIYFDGAMRISIGLFLIICYYINYI